MGGVSMAADLGYPFGLQVYTDSSGAKGIAMRRGVAKVRHLHTGLLWLQTRVRRGDIKVQKIMGTQNLSDLATKHLDAKTMNRFLRDLGFVFKCGSSGLALKAAQVDGKAGETA